MIMPYNRVVKDLNGHDKQEFMDEVSKIFDVTASDVPVELQVKGQVGMYMDGSLVQAGCQREGIVPDDAVDNFDVCGTSGQCACTDTWNSIIRELIRGSCS